MTEIVFVNGFGPARQAEFEQLIRLGQENSVEEQFENYLMFQQRIANRAAVGDYPDVPNIQITIVHSVSGQRNAVTSNNGSAFPTIQIMA